MAEGQDAELLRPTPVPTEVPTHTPEKTEEQQKIEALFGRVSEVNQQLGGGLAFEMPASDGASVLLFRGVGLSEGTRTPTVFGVSSTEGPIRLTEDTQYQFLSPGSWFVHPPKEFEEGRQLDRGKDYIGFVDLEEWQDAFARSRDAVLKDQKAMERLRAARIKTLDKALSIVSEPTDISAGPTETSTQTLPSP